MTDHVELDHPCPLAEAAQAMERTFHRLNETGDYAAYGDDAALLEARATGAAIVRNAFWTALSRFPTATETRAAP